MRKASICVHADAFLREISAPAAGRGTRADRPMQPRKKFSSKEGRYQSLNLSGNIFMADRAIHRIAMTAKISAMFSSIY
jgi:hypothetical protein